jgi:hypothetical protein
MSRDNNTTKKRSSTATGDIKRDKEIRSKRNYVKDVGIS